MKLKQELAPELTEIFSATPFDVRKALVFMQQHGQSATLNWGEDNNEWECSWISDGRRFLAFSADPVRAAIGCLNMAFHAILESSYKCTCGPDYYDKFCPNHGTEPPENKWSKPTPSRAGPSERHARRGGKSPGSVSSATAGSR